MPNPGGHAETLAPAPAGNLRGLKHGVCSEGGRALAPRARAIEAALLEMPHLVPVDAIGISEIASLLATLEAIDKALADGRVENKRGQVRALLATKATLSRQLREWRAGEVRRVHRFRRHLPLPGGIGA